MQDQRPEASGSISHVEGSREMPEYPNPEAMATAFGAPVWVPTRWPGGAEPRYAVYRPDPRSTSQALEYRCWLNSDVRGLRGLVIGARVRYPMRAGDGLYFAVPELAAVDGIAERNGTVIADVGGHSLLFVAFASLEEAVAVAASLQRVDPAD